MNINRVLKLTDEHSGSTMNHNEQDSDGSSNPSNEMSKGTDHSSHQPKVKPTWASPNPVYPHVYVTGNGNDKIYVVDTNSWTVSDVWNSPGKAPYNLEPTYSGDRLVVTYKGEGAVGIWDIEKGEQLAKLKSSRRVSHGVVISPDDKYAFVSSEGIGGESGTVDIIDLGSLKIVDTVEVGKQAAGIAFWKIEN